MRSLDDVTTWFTQPCTGTAETSAGPYWRLIPDNVKIVVVRRPVGDVVESLMRLGLPFDRDVLTKEMHRLDRKLNQIEARRDCLSVTFDDLNTEETCKAVFEHCLPYEHNPAWWAHWAPVNVQCDMLALMRYMVAYRPQLEKLAKVAKHKMLTAMQVKPPVINEGMTFQEEDFDSWLQGARSLFNDHLVMVGEAPGDWQSKNIPALRRIYDVGAMQITTARCNGKMFGYLVTLVTPSLEKEGRTWAANNTYYASPDVPGLGLKLQRESIRRLKEKGVHELFAQAGVRGSGERIASIYKRLGAANDGQMFRLQLEGV